MTNETENQETAQYILKARAIGHERANKILIMANKIAGEELRRAARRERCIVGLWLGSMALIWAAQIAQALRWWPW